MKNSFPESICKYVPCVVGLSIVSCCSTLLTPLFGEEKTNRPNIILILTDDQGWSQLNTPMSPQVPVASSSYLETPNMSMLAERGMRFPNGYSPAPLCTPKRRNKRNSSE